MTSPIYNLTANAINGDSIQLSEYAGKVLLIVNTASACGFTKQYKGLQNLHLNHNDQGLSVLGFPCNQFGQQEKGDSNEISQFCEINFGVTFPLFAKVEVNGDNTHPLFAHLKHAAKGILGSERIKWNFTKFLINREGEVVKRYSPATKPEKIEADIQALL